MKIVQVKLGTKRSFANLPPLIKIRRSPSFAISGKFIELFECLPRWLLLGPRCQSDGLLQFLSSELFLAIQGQCLAQQQVPLRHLGATLQTGPVGANRLRALPK